MEDRFVTNKTFKINGPRKQFHGDFDKPFIDALTSSGHVNINIDKTKEILRRFRSDYAIKLNKKPNAELKTKWIKYWEHEQ